ncbi:hypothetical protein M9458_033278 [Cirrhinus mrigala]|uniref:Uncharacterized protein n=1 Tax=Cirrhinus mrigala TaxID=683832 RepID=A0ABD0PFX6_CIRMR
MNDLAILVLLLEQGVRSLEYHTKDFAFLANLTHYLDRCLCSLVAYVEWVLVSCISQLAVDFVDDDTSPTLDPEPSPASPRFTDGEPETSATNEPLPSGVTVLRIAPEPELITSDQLREPASSYVTVEVTVDPAHCTSTEGEQTQDSEDFNYNEDIYADMPPPILPSSELSIDPEPSVCPDLSACLDFYPPSLFCLIHSSLPHPTAHPQPTICVVGLPWVCQFPSASWLEDPSSPSPASDPAAPPRLLSPLSPIGQLAPPGSLVPLAPPWLVVDPQVSTPPALVIIS